MDIGNPTQLKLVIVFSEILLKKYSQQNLVSLWREKRQRLTSGDKRGNQPNDAAKNAAPDD